MIVHRLYTEDINRTGIHAILQEHFDTYTLIPAQGVWNGVVEDTLIIELVTDGAHDAVNLKLRIVIECIKVANRQTCVLYTRQVVESELL